MNTREKIFLIWSGQSENNFKTLSKLLGGEGWRAELLANLDRLEDCASSTSNRLICLGFFDPLDCSVSGRDLDLISRFYSCGHSLIVSGCENEKGRDRGKLNDLVRRFGVKFRDDCVIRPNPYKQYHPKDAQLEEFIENRGLSDSVRKFTGNRRATTTAPSEGKLLRDYGPRIIYAKGCTLTVNRRVSTVMMTSSKWALPNRQAICSFHRSSSKESRMIAIGSTAMLTDAYIDKEDNVSLVKALLEFVGNKNFPISISDAKTIDIPEAIVAPDLDQLIDLPIACLQESQPLPEDKSLLMDRRLFNVDNSMLPAIIKAFKDLNVARGPLTLIKPPIERPMIDLEPATHGFLLRKRSSNSTTTQ